MSFLELNEFKGYSSRRNLFATPLDIMRVSENTLVENGEIVKRKAFKEIKNINQGSIAGFYEYYYGGARAIILRKNTSTYDWYVYTGSSLATVNNYAATSGATAFPVSFAEYNNVLYTAEDAAISRKLFQISGTQAFERMGVPPPNASYATSNVAAHASQVSSVNWTAGNYEYAASFRITGNITWESDIFVIGTYNLATPGTTLVPKITVHSLSPAYDNHTISHVIYYRRNVTAGQSLFYKIGDAAHTNNTDIVFNDFSGAGDPASQDTSIIGPTTHGYLSGTSLRALCIFKSRLLAHDNNGKLYISEVGYPDYIQSTSFLPVGDPFDAVKKLVVYGDTCLIIKEKSVWSLTGNSWADFRVDQVLDFGTNSANSVFIFNNSLYFTNDQAIWRWEIGQGKPIKISDGIDYDFQAARSTFSSSIIGYDPESGNIWVNLGSTKTFIYDPVENNWIGTFVHTHAPDCCGTVGNFTGYKKKGAFIYNSKLYSYNEESGISGTYETQMSVVAILGMKFDRSSIKKLIKNIVLYDRSGIYASTVSQSISFVCTLLSSTQATLLGSVTFNNTYVNTKDIGKSDYGIAFGVSGTTINIDPTWSLWGLEIEWEPVGVRR